MNACMSVCVIGAKTRLGRYNLSAFHGPHRPYVEEDSTEL